MNRTDEDCCECNQIGQKKARTTCPQCKEEGVPVSSVTVRHLVKEEYLQTSEEGLYEVCMNPACDVVYFGLDTERMFSQGQVKVPIWFKDGAKPKYACYCSRITEEEVIRAVVELGADSLKQIIEVTGAMKDSACIENNPLGVCCHRIIEEAMLKGRALR